MKIKLPPVFAISLRRNGNTISQLLSPIATVDGTSATYKGNRISGTVLVPADAGQILVTRKKVKVPESFDCAIYNPETVRAIGGLLDYSAGSWLKHPALSGALQADPVASAAAAYASWHNAFRYVQENLASGSVGLRNPQIGALHAILAHWTVGNEPATIVMPTGTGKTETMLSVLVSVPCKKVLVVVPTDALRSQISEKFITLGVLKKGGVASTGALYPVVGVANRKPTSIAEVDELFKSCNVIVTTSHIAGQSDPALKKQFALHCDYLFIDEAHHVEASTWRSLKECFQGRRILQFTATPFREDDKVLDGKIIYKYPLRKAQEEGFFKPIRFTAVVEFNPAKADRAIAEAALAALKSDTTGKHVLMARVGTIDRAQEVYKLYEGHQQFAPIQMHTGIKSRAAREENRKRLISGRSRIVICVDMLGEGFDLPELKIAAFHDIRKSLAVTLQIAGRFTRARPDLGDATFIANVGDVNVQDELRKLYAQDPDWNVLLPELSEKIIGEQLEVRQFLDGFNQFPADIPLRSLRPATSTVVYRTKCESWSPQRFQEGLDPVESYARVHHSLNPASNTLVVVTARSAPVEWAEIEELRIPEWELYVLTWDPETNLLYINSSGNRGVFKRLAEAVAGENVELIREPEVYRCFAGITRLRLTNVGLTEQIARLVSFTGRMGADVEKALSEAHKRNTRKAVLFGSGFENGARTTVGASRRGRVWSFRRVRLNALADWCKGVGSRLVDASIDPDKILEGTLKSEQLSSRPAVMPIGIDWPEELYRDNESAFAFLIDGDRQWPLYETSIELTAPSEAGEIGFRLVRDGESVAFTLRLFEKEDDSKDYRFSIAGSGKASIGARAAVPLERFFYDYPPVIWFADGSSLEGNLLTRLRSGREPFGRSRIARGDWHGITLSKESQGISKDKDSIQFRVISNLLKRGEHEIVFDDDGSGEVADVVAIKVVSDGLQDIINADLYHCKYSHGPEAGARLADLYEVCGQAQKSVSWAQSPDKLTDMFSHLLRRESMRGEKKEATRFEKGDKQSLLRIREMSRVSPVRIRIAIVQPGLSKEDASPAQLELLAVTENYLLETYKIPFGVMGSSSDPKDGALLFRS
jgi:superfamily II DNA or RNA helicase